MIQLKNIKDEGKLSVITSKDRWQEAISRVRTYDFYHTYDYHELSKLNGENQTLLYYEEATKIICLPIIIRKIDATGYYDATSVYGYAGPLEKNIDESFDNTQYLEILTSFFTENKIIAVFSRLNPFINNQKVILNRFGKIIPLGNVVTINLKKSIDDQFSAFSKTTKRYLNKARKKFKIKISATTEDIVTFKKLYHENMKRVNANESYYFDDSYFFKLMQNDNFKTEIISAIDNESGEIVSAVMIIKCNTIIQYHLSGTKAEYLNYSPIRLLIDEARIKGATNNFSFLNLGGGLANKDDELFRFKASFSKEFKTFEIWQCILDKKIYKELTNATNIDKDINFFPLYRYSK